MNKFFQNESLIYRAVITRPPYPLDAFHLLLTSQWLGAKSPDDQQKQFDITLSRDQLTKLSDIIRLHLRRIA